MILHNPIIKKSKDQVIISSRFEMLTALPDLPQDLWYRFQGQYETCLSLRADGFAATALLMAMYAGENLTIRAPISPKLAYGLIEYRNVFHTWLPKIYHMVDVNYEHVEKPLQNPNRAVVAAAFSGGVDSFFTLWSHLPENQSIPEARITDGLFIHGYDLRLDEEEVFQALAQKYSIMFRNLGLNLILCSTNAYQFSQFRIDWSLFHGAPLIGAALLLSPFLQRFYIPAGYAYDELIPQGSSVLVDHLLSTENVDVVHHGASTNRFQKISVLSNWSVTYEHLRVCAHKHQSREKVNCSRCHKCIRTMAALTILNALPNYTTFSPRLTILDYLRWGLQSHMSPIFAGEIQKRAWKSRKFIMAFQVWIALSINRVVVFPTALIKRFLPNELLYQIKRKLLKPEYGAER